METVKRFLQQEGSIGVLDRACGTRMLHPALPEHFDLAQTSNRLWHNGMWHSREEFLQLCINFKIGVHASPTSDCASELMVF
jgi:hypothetical protein